MGGNYYPDFVTNLVAKQSSAVISGFDYQSEVVPNQTEPNMILYVNGTYLARIIEGCNSISIIILFMSFIIAFAQNRKKTIVFLFAGAVIIYAFNIFRIVVLSILLYEYPQYSNVLHTVVFPGIIYGIVFLLWMIWVQLLNPVKQNG